jgi:hypothetical protein
LRSYPQEWRCPMPMVRIPIFNLEKGNLELRPVSESV